MNATVQPLRARIRKSDGEFIGYIERDRSAGAVLRAATLPGIVKDLFAAGVRQMFPARDTMPHEECESVERLVFEEYYRVAKAAMIFTLALDEPGDEALLRKAVLFYLREVNNDYKRVRVLLLTRHGVRVSVADIALIHSEEILPDLLASCAAIRSADVSPAGPS